MRIVGVYHVYQMGKGEIDGIQDAGELGDKIDKIDRGEWGHFEGEVSGHGISFMGMFGLGIITSLSPCSIVLLVAMLSYVLSSKQTESTESGSKRHERNGFLIGIGFTLGMALVFFIIGLFISSVGDLVRASSFFYLLAGILLILLGFNNLKSLGEIFSPIISRLSPGSRDTGSDESGTNRSMKERMIEFSTRLLRYSTFLGGFVLGIFFALAWAPCAVSLVFPVIIWMLSRDISLIVGALMLFVFGLGHGIPVIPLATFGTSIRGKVGEKYMAVGKWTTRIFGVVVITFGIIFILRYFGYYLW